MNITSLHWYSAEKLITRHPDTLKFSSSTFIACYKDELDCTSSLPPAYKEDLLIMGQAYCCNDQKYLLVHAFHGSVLKPRVRADVISLVLNVNESGEEILEWISDCDDRRISVSLSDYHTDLEGSTEITSVDGSQLRESKFWAFVGVCIPEEPPVLTTELPFFVPLIRSTASGIVHRIDFNGKSAAISTPGDIFALPELEPGGQQSLYFHHFRDISEPGYDVCVNQISATIYNSVDNYRYGYDLDSEDIEPAEQATGYPAVNGTIRMIGCWDDENLGASAISAFNIQSSSTAIGVYWLANGRIKFLDWIGFFPGYGTPLNDLGHRYFDEYLNKEVYAYPWDTINTETTSTVVAFKSVGPRISATCDVELYAAFIDTESGDSENTYAISETIRLLTIKAPAPRQDCQAQGIPEEEAGELVRYCLVARIVARVGIPIIGIPITIRTKKGDETIGNLGISISASQEIVEIDILCFDKDDEISHIGLASVAMEEITAAIADYVISFTGPIGVLIAKFIDIELAIERK